MISYFHVVLCLTIQHHEAVAKSSDGLLRCRGDRGLEDFGYVAHLAAFQRQGCCGLETTRRGHPFSSAHDAFPSYSCRVGSLGSIGNTSAVKILLKLRMKSPVNSVQSSSPLKGFHNAAATGASPTYSRFLTYTRPLSQAGKHKPKRMTWA